MYFAITGTTLCIFAGGKSFMGGARVLMFFTIQSNIALAIISLIGFMYLSILNRIKKAGDKAE